MSDRTIELPIAYRTATTMRPRRMTVIITSINVRPRSCEDRRPRDNSDLHLAEDAVHRRHERDGDEPDDDPHEDDDRGLEEAGEALDLVVELLLVEPRCRLELLVER